MSAARKKPADSTKARKKLLNQLMGKLGYQFQDSMLLERALTRTSSQHNVRLDFQPLELIGDAALKHIVSLLLFDKQSSCSAQQLHDQLQPLIQNDKGRMASIAESLDIDRCIPSQSNVA
jgi:dsRNA-specific ribonuclease